ncbi:OLC1v1000347C2 [Oldenlandia corymbosa var. corymbosa]|uniref:OLC1v1000347C2 n=1 Tax=Oldenlandia corymbosa var. corymbosa TaxID=529605 RepID=A0AAV1D322_OLDCO|nr:OLC1v1000347C2 [Oldenlandia corymbosa var. corymbosa]
MKLNHNRRGILEMEDDTYCSDQYDVMDFLDEQYLSSSPNFGEEFLQNSNQSPESNSSCISTINITNPTPQTTTTTTAHLASTLSSTNHIDQNLLPLVPNIYSVVMETPPEEPVVVVERPAKQLKRANNTKTPIILTFGNPVCVPEIINPSKTLKSHDRNPQQDDDALSEVLMTSNRSFTSLEEASKSTAVVAQPKTAKNRKRVRPESQTYDHIIAERKRREQLSQRFMALSAIVPGLKKMDKTSVLGDTITYLKHLKERVSMLEEQATKQTVESVVLVKKSQLMVEDQVNEVGNEPNGRNSNIKEQQQPLLPEIEAKVSDKKVLLRVHCENHKGVLVKLISEVEKLNLAITNTSVAVFGSFALDITIIAEMEQEFNTTTKELVRSLQSALHRVGLLDM